MKIISQMFDKIKIFFRYLSKILPLFIGIAALYVAIESMNNANEQFLINSNNADSLFNVQLKNSKELNDSLIRQISILQDITNKQLQITDQQLNISMEVLKDQIYSGRPKININSSKIADTIKISDDIFQLRIETDFQNIGKRNADDLTIRTFFLYNKLSTIRKDKVPRSSQFILPEQRIRNNVLLTIDKKFMNDFYYCFDITYYDKKLEEKFSSAFYYHYYELGGIYNFYYCEKRERKIIRDILNKFIKAPNGKPFDQ